MLISKNWLSDYVNVDDVSAEELAEQLTLKTVEVEGICTFGKLLHNIVVGSVVSVGKHPDADKLKVCLVDIGDEKIKVVCGGSNLRIGMHVALGKLGAFVRWHGEGEPVKLEKTNIRGVESFGMICSADEIGLGELFPKKDEKEILDLTQMQLKIGAPLIQALAQDDVIIDIDNKSMTHRPDLWGHYGMAREVSAIFGKKFSVYKSEKIKFGKGIQLDVTVKDTVLCPRYMGVVVRGIEIGPSPSWMQARLQSVGLRPINNIVDITNYVMMDFGQPMHAFDANKLEGEKKISIIVRKAKSGEKIKTLDGLEHELTKETLVIADSKKAIAIAGIIGGANSEVDENTNTIILESANFDSGNIRRTSTDIGVRTDSSSRFEKSLDPNNAVIALSRALELIYQIIPNAKVCSSITDVSTFKLNQGPIKFDFKYLKERIGVDISEKDVLSMLESLGFAVKLKSGVISVNIPSWRATKDISIKEDIIEEVARMYGYENIGTELPIFSINPPLQDPIKLLERNLKERLVLTHNFIEVKNYSFVSPDWISKIGINTKDHLELENPIAKDRPLLRRSLVPNMLQNLESNLHRFDSVKIFETGRVFIQELPGEQANPKNKEFLPKQENMLSIVFSRKGNYNPFYKISGALLQVFGSLGSQVELVRDKTKDKFIHPGRYAKVQMSGTTVGWIGELHPSAQNNLGILYKVAICEINLDECLKFIKEKINYSKLAHYPSVSRDIAFVVSEQVEHADIVEHIEKIDNLILSIELFDVYIGDKLGEGTKSMAYRLVYQSKDRTLQAQEVDLIEKKVKEVLKNIFGAEIRD